MTIILYVIMSNLLETQFFPAVLKSQGITTRPQEHTFENWNSPYKILKVYPSISRVAGFLWTHYLNKSAEEPETSAYDTTYLSTDRVHGVKLALTLYTENFAYSCSQNICVTQQTENSTKVAAPILSVKHPPIVLVNASGLPGTLAIETVRKSPDLADTFAALFGSSIKRGYSSRLDSIDYFFPGSIYFPSSGV